MIGDVAAPVDGDQVGPDGGRLDQHVGRVGPDAERVDVRVLEQEQPVVGPNGRPGLGGVEERVLQGVRVVVGNRTEPPSPEGHEISASQSRVSMIVLTSRRKAAA